ncbi:hypothetical protein [Rhizobium sp.]|uniref:hypothetical protein n=1 Tax=Rhizobium sp. TaxID=391 RepID=UPI0028A7D00B
MKYFRLLDDINFPKRWHLGDLIGIDGMEFVRPPMLPMDDPLRAECMKLNFKLTVKR